MTFAFLPVCILSVDQFHRKMTDIQTVRKIVCFMHCSQILHSTDASISGVSERSSIRFPIL